MFKGENTQEENIVRRSGNMDLRRLLGVHNGKRFRRLEAERLS